MCYTSWFELHNERFNAYYSATILLCQPVRVGSVGGVCLTCAIQLLWKELSGYICFGFNLKVKCLSYLLTSEFMIYDKKE